MNSSRMIRNVVSFALAMGVLACNAVLGYSEATVDPKLTPVGETGTQTQAVTCDTYCATITANCTDKLAEYLNEDICKAMCSHFDQGIPNDQSGDSLACRNYHAHNAKDAPKDHCKHAGPTGAGHCGTDPCVAFCALDVALCTGPLLPYPGGELACRQQCAKYTYLLGPEDQELVGEGPTLNCRLYHLESAYDAANPQAKITHCPHTAVVSTHCF